VSEQLCSVGLDVGTTTTQLVVSRLTVENRASAFAVPKLEITGRQILYESPVHFTPLMGKERVDGEAIARLVEREYLQAGITREEVDTGAVIITGETSRKENARAVLQALSGFAGEFVVATAGPDLESILAAKGAGAVDYSAQTGKTVIHMDIGGGTSNLARIENGRITATGCLNVGGRLLRREQGRITYLSPALEGLTDLRVGDTPREDQLRAVAEQLTQALEMAVGLRPPTTLLDKLTTREAAGVLPWEKAEVISFSGGVADCVEKEYPADAFGDIGPLLGRAIRESALCSAYTLGRQTIRATVIGAGCHSTQLSGSTVFFRDAQLPLQNLPVAAFSYEEQEAPDLAAMIRQRLAGEDAAAVVLALPGYDAPSYSRVQRLARAIREGTAGRPVLVALERDMAKALGHSLCLQLTPGTPVLCIDRVVLAEGSYLDVGNPIGPALPVVVKTLVLETRKGGTA